VELKGTFKFVIINYLKVEHFVFSYCVVNVNLKKSVYVVWFVFFMLQFFLAFKEIVLIIFLTKLRDKTGVGEDKQKRR
jgi:hypothetical protein